MQDLLAIQVEIPEIEDPLQQDILKEAVASPGLFEAQLYLFETTGTLVSLVFRTPDRATALLSSLVKPLLQELSEGLQSVTGPDDVIPILQVHHSMMALGNIAKGFPDFPSPVPEGYILAPLDVFRDVAQAILVSLEAMNVFKVIRDAVCVREHLTGVFKGLMFVSQARFAFARMIATTGPTVTPFIPPLMVNLLAHFEPSELVDFMSFISLLIHKLQVCLFLCSYFFYMARN